MTVMETIGALNNSNKTIKSISFTGPRPKKLRDYDHDKYVKFVDELTKILIYITGLFGIERYVSGGAQGFDQLAFWAVNKAKRAVGNTETKNIVYKPFEGHELRWLETGLFSQSEYRTMCSMADEVKILSQGSNDYRTTAKLLDDRNHAMVNDTDLVIALYPSGNWRTAAHSGTANCMKYAVKNNKPILQLLYDENSDGELKIIGATLIRA